MLIESVTLSGFRCFGPEPITVAVSSEITAVVGLVYEVRDAELVVSVVAIGKRERNAVYRDAAKRQ